MIIGLVGLGLGFADMACAIGPADGVARTSRLKLDVRCTADVDCPTGFECVTEVELGTSKTYCESLGLASSSSDGGVACPPGFEVEVEHGSTFCKPHKSAGDGDAGSPSDSGGDSKDDDATVSGDGAPSGGDGGLGDVCTTSADCTAGLECEVEIEHGVKVSRCKAHGGKKH
jgi:hypothetical protein